GGPGLRALGDFDGLFSIDAGHFDLGSKRERREGERNGAVQVIAVALEELVLAHEDDHVKIAGRTNKRSPFPSAGETQPLRGRDAGGNLHGQLASLFDGAVAPAVRARLGDHFAGAAALPAGPRDGEESLLIPQLTSAAAPRT